MVCVHAQLITKYAMVSLISRTECSSCFTSITVLSLNVHLTMSVSSLAPLTYSLLLTADQNLEKSYLGC